MANKSDRKSVLGRLAAGTTIEGHSTGSVGTDKGPAEKVASPQPVGNGSSTGPGTNTGTNTGTGAKPGPVSVSDAFPTRKPGEGTGPGTGAKPHFGRHPKTGEQVEIDYSQPGATAAAPFGFTATGKVRTKRPRKQRAKAGSASQAKTGQNITAIADAIKFAHNGIAAVTKHSHWQQDDGEAQAMADALTDLQSAYGVDISPEQAAWIKALTVIAIPTGMRVYASMHVARSEKAKPVSQAPANKPDTDNSKQVKANAPTVAGDKPKGPLTPSMMVLESGGRFDDTTG